MNDLQADIHKASIFFRSNNVAELINNATQEPRANSMEECAIALSNALADAIRRPKMDQLGKVFNKLFCMSLQIALE
jgi:hypothetical protein